MTSGDRAEFERELAVLFAAIDKPVTEARSEAFWRGVAKMSLPEFSRCIELLLRELSEGETPRYFSVSDLWAAKRRSRAPPVTYMHQQSAPGSWDGWDVRANHLLLKHLSMRLAADSRAYGPRRSCLPGETCYSPEQERATIVLLGYKHAWARDMREAAAELGEVRIETQREAWRDCMARAEAEIAHQARQPALLEAHA